MTTAAQRTDLLGLTLGLRHHAPLAAGAPLQRWWDLAAEADDVISGRVTLDDGRAQTLIGRCKGLLASHSSNTTKEAS